MPCDGTAAMTIGASGQRRLERRRRRHAVADAGSPEGTPAFSRVRAISSISAAVAAPQPHVVADRGRSARRARCPSCRRPGRRSRSLTAAPPCRALGARATMRRMLARWRNRIRTPVPSAAAKTDGGEPVSQATDGSVTVAATEPERDHAREPRPWRRTPPPPASSRAARARRTRPPRPRPLCRRGSAARRDRCGRRPPPRRPPPSELHATRPPRTPRAPSPRPCAMSSAHHGDAERRARGPQHVRRADVAAARHAHVDPGAPREQVRKRHRADRVAEENPRDHR